MVLRLMVLTASLLTAACAALPDAARESSTVQDSPGPIPDAWEEAAAAGATLRALGQEPGWYLTVIPGRGIRLVYDYGEHRLLMPAPLAERTDAGVRYRSRSSGEGIRPVTARRHQRGPRRLARQSSSCPGKA